MVIGIILAALVGVIVPYLPSGNTDPSGQAIDLYPDDPNTTEVVIENPSTGTIVELTGTTIVEDTIISGDAVTPN